jgi:hypothetical protein
MDQQLSPSQLQALLEDTQASLAASFARIEAYRLQNKQLRDEVASLRNQVHGNGQEQGPSVQDRACSLTFPQMRNAASSSQHPITIVDGPSGRKVGKCREAARRQYRSCVRRCFLAGPRVPGHRQRLRRFR